MFLLLTAMISKCIYIFSKMALCLLPKKRWDSCIFYRPFWAVSIPAEVFAASRRKCTSISYGSRSAVSAAALKFASAAKRSCCKHNHWYWGKRRPFSSWQGRVHFARFFFLSWQGKRWFFRPYCCTSILTLIQHSCLRHFEYFAQYY